MNRPVQECNRQTIRRATRPQVCPERFTDLHPATPVTKTQRPVLAYYLPAKAQNHFMHTQIQLHALESTPMNYGAVRNFSGFKGQGCARFVPSSTHPSPVLLKTINLRADKFHTLS
jgi:hypothetical protein